MTYDDIPRMEHERRYRAEREPDAALRVIEPEDDWRVPQAEPPVPKTRTEPRVAAFRIRNGLCLVCAQPTPEPSHLCGGDSCHHDVIDRG